MSPLRYYTFEYGLFAGLAFSVITLPFSIQLCNAGLLIVIISWVITGNWNEKWNSIRSNIILIPFAVFFILNLLGLLYTHDASNSWFNLEKKISWIILPVILASSPLLSKKKIQSIFLLFIGACFAGALVCLFNATYLYLTNAPANKMFSALYDVLNPTSSDKWIFFSYASLSSGISIHPTYFSLYLLFSLLLLYKIFHEDFLRLPSRRRIALIALVIYFSVFIVLLSSRIAMLELVLLSFTGTFLLFEGSHWQKRIAACCVTCFLIASLIYINPVSRYRNFEEPLYLSFPSQNSHQTLSISIRASLWWLSVQSTKDINLAWGAGPGDVKAVVKNTSKKYAVSNVLETFDPHNQFLQTLLALGLLGLASLILCFLIPSYLAFRGGDFFYMTFVALFVLVGLTESVLEMQKGIVFFAIFNSLLIFQCGGYWSSRGGKKLTYG